MRAFLYLSPAGPICSLVRAGGGLYLAFIDVYILPQPCSSRGGLYTLTARPAFPPQPPPTTFSPHTPPGCGEQDRANACAPPASCMLQRRCPHARCRHSWFWRDQSSWTGTGLIRPYLRTLPLPLRSTHLHSPATPSPRTLPTYLTAPTPQPARQHTPGEHRANTIRTPV